MEKKKNKKRKNKYNFRKANEGYYVVKLLYMPNIDIPYEQINSRQS